MKPAIEEKQHSWHLKVSVKLKRFTGMNESKSQINEFFSVVVVVVRDERVEKVNGKVCF